MSERKIKKEKIKEKCVSISDGAGVAPDFLTAMTNKYFKDLTTEQKPLSAVGGTLRFQRFERLSDE